MSFKNESSTKICYGSPYRFWTFARRYSFLLASLLSSCRTIPWKIMQPCSLDFDPDASIRIGPSFEPKLLFSLFAFKFRRKATHGQAL